MSLNTQAILDGIDIESLKSDVEKKAQSIARLVMNTHFRDPVYGKAGFGYNLIKQRVEDAIKDPALIEQIDLEVKKALTEELPKEIQRVAVARARRIAKDQAAK